MGTATQPPSTTPSDTNLNALRAALTDPAATASPKRSRRIKRPLSQTLAANPTLPHRTAAPATSIAPKSQQATGSFFKRGHLILVAVTILLMFRPVLVLGSLLVLTVITLVGFAYFGSARIWLGLEQVIERRAMRNPQRAARLVALLDRAAMRWDLLLDCFPEGSVNGLYMPDFQSLNASIEAFAADHNRHRA